MAIGGALRAAIKAGNWASAARESRRRARALADLNARGGIRGAGERFPNTSQEFFNRGYAYGAIPPSRMEMAGLPLENNGLPFAYTTRNTPPSGRTNYVNPETGARATFAPNVGLPRYGNPIEAPYEGMRVWPYGARNPVPDVPEWMGAGYPPAVRTPWAEDYGFFDAYAPYSSNNPMSDTVPRVFGGTLRRETATPSWMSNPTYYFDDVASPGATWERGLFF